MKPAAQSSILGETAALTTKEAAAALGVNASRVRQLILSGKLPAEKHGRDWMINQNDLALVRNRRPGRPKKEKK